nr:generative cell specific-1 paralog [Pleodorina starrii]
MHFCILNYVILYTFVCFFLWVPRASAEVLVAGRLEKCNTTEAIPCSTKIVVPLTFGGGRTLSAAENFKFTVKCVNSPDGHCPCPCSAAIDENCSCRDLLAPLRVTLNKSLVATYALTYLQTFDQSATEISFLPPDGVCKDHNEPNTTCGLWPGSQGFCCKCNSSKEGHIRARLSCMNGSITTYAAHCMKRSGSRHVAYQMGPASPSFSISVTVAVTTTSAPAPTPSSAAANNDNTTASGTTTLSNIVTTRYEELLLSTSSPYSRNSELVHATLEGKPQLPDFSNRLLVLPEPASSDRKGLLDMNNNQRTSWMLIEKGSFSMDGAACDKIGTGSSAFLHQPNGCDRAPGACLSGQLNDLYNADMQRVRNGSVPLYMVTQYNTGEEAKLNIDAGVLSFALPVTSQTEFVVTLSVAADNVQLTTNGSPGQGGVSGLMKMYSFSANATIMYNEVTPTNGTSGNDTSAAGSCKKVCKSAINVVCFMKNRCWSKVAVFLGILGGSAAGCYFLYWVAKRYWCNGMAAANTAARAYPEPQWRTNPHAQQHPQDGHDFNSIDRRSPSPWQPPARTYQDRYADADRPYGFDGYGGGYAAGRRHDDWAGLNSNDRRSPSPWQPPARTYQDRYADADGPYGFGAGYAGPQSPMRGEGPWSDGFYYNRYG